MILYRLFRLWLRFQTLLISKGGDGSSYTAMDSEGDVVAETTSKAMLGRSSPAGLAVRTLNEVLPNYGQWGHVDPSMGVTNENWEGPF